VCHITITYSPIHGCNICSISSHQAGSSPIVPTEVLRHPDATFSRSKLLQKRRVLPLGSGSGSGSVQNQDQDKFRIRLRLLSSSRALCFQISARCIRSAPDQENSATRRHLQHSTYFGDALGLGATVRVRSVVTRKRYCTSYSL
jgi:hypothetical protein